MPKEIERKFLVVGDKWRASCASRREIRQGFLSLDPERIVRVRVMGDSAYIAIKGAMEGITRDEYEYPIPADDARELLDGLCIKPLIEKIRYEVEVDGTRWEVDEFLGVNAGLVVAEVEVAEEGQRIALPDWVGREVSDDPRYANAALVTRPWCEWNSEPG